MIRPNFYQKRNLLRPQALAPRFPFVERQVVTSSRPYIIQTGETLYSIAARLFGNDAQHYWTVIADINIPRYPDDWETGDTILLPETIVSETYHNQ